ncbi:hypothetical protein L914_08826 [Phytophthora nicotianae]|uniref:Anthranilate synthase component I N-terminal domain-containing protein n=1 Tax=Phytophthora nicotianae TaxID=4792 RepID=W2NCJ7_PHYNI|nr:hypothetical protein L914_08826 [Phytophthora nicotianae]
MKNFRMKTLLGLNVPFTGGVVGYCGFDAILNFEPKIARNFDAQKDVLQVSKASTCSSTRSSSSSTSSTSSCTCQFSLFIKVLAYHNFVTTLI